MIKKMKPGKWQVRVSYKDLDGQYRTKTKSFTTKGEAQYWERETESAINDGSFFEEERKVTFAGYFEDWCRTYKMVDVTQSTINKYEHDIRLVHNFFKGKLLNEVTRKDYQQFISLRGKGNGRDIMEKTHFRIKSCMQDALHDQLIDRDPTWRAIITYDNKPSDKLKYWDLDELTKLMDYFRNGRHPMDAMFYLLATTGLRIGEAYGLAWENITKDTLTVQRGYQHNYKKFTKGKNKSSLRTIQIDPETYKVLMEYKVKYQRKCPEYVFLDPRLQPIMTYRGATKHLKQVCKELGVRELTPHAFRHSHCCLLIYNRVDINYIAGRLGHSSVIETQKTYSHVIKELEEKESEKVLNAITMLTSQLS